jgi:tetratricopeptide (TPR) repeat protein
MNDAPPHNELLRRLQREVRKRHLPEAVLEIAIDRIKTSKLQSESTPLGDIQIEQFLSTSMRIHQALEQLQCIMAERALPDEVLGIAWPKVQETIEKNEGKTVQDIGIHDILTVSLKEFNSEERPERLTDATATLEGIGDFVDRPVWSEADEQEQGEFLSYALQELHSGQNVHTPTELTQRVLEAAAERLNKTESRYMTWLWRLFQGATVLEISGTDNVPQGTIRSGISRVLKRLDALVYELRYHYQAALHGEVNSRLEEIHALIGNNQLAEAKLRLETCRKEFEYNPRWYLLLAKVLRRLGYIEEAISTANTGLIHADEPTHRGELYNTLGYIYDESKKDREMGLFYYRRATHVAPDLPQPWLNLLCDASMNKDIVQGRMAIQNINRLIRDQTLSTDEKERMYQMIEQKDNPDLKWIRRQDEWKRVCAGWLVSLRAAVPMALILLSLAQMLTGFLESQQLLSFGKGDVLKQAVAYGKGGRLDSKENQQDFCHVAFYGKGDKAAFNTVSGTQV